MLTCRSLYEASVPHLLIRQGQEEDFTLRNAYYMQSFCRFVLRQPERRPSCIRRLSLCDVGVEDRGPKIPYDEWPKLHNDIAQVLFLATNLREFRIDCVDDFLEHSPHLSPAISSLSKLRTLYMSYVPVGSLPELSAPLQDVDLHLDGCSSVGVDIQDLLKSSADSLVKLKLTITFNCLAVSDLAPDIQFPNLRKLVLKTETGEPRLDALMHACPNVQYFSWSDNDECEEDDLEPRDSERMREENLQRTRGAWSQLEELDASLDNCYTAAIQSHVRVWRVDEELVRDNLRRFHVVLAGLRPSALVVRIGVRELSEKDWDDLFPASSSVRHLDVAVKPADNELPVQDTLVRRSYCHYVSK